MWRNGKFQWLTYSQFSCVSVAVVSYLTVLFTTEFAWNWPVFSRLLYLQSFSTRHKQFTSIQNSICCTVIPEYTFCSFSCCSCCLGNVDTLGSGFGCGLREGQGQNAVFKRRLDVGILSSDFNRHILHSAQILLTLTPWGSLRVLENFPYFLSLMA